MLSTTGAASGALDVIAAACAINEGKIPAAQNFQRNAEGCDLNIVREVKNQKIQHAISCSYTYGGQTAAVILKKID
jgi:3-oxoacyl-(acyl-carrier-protein) synthase